MWRKFEKILILMLVFGNVSLWASVQRDSTMGEFKNDVDWAVDLFDVGKMKRSFFAVGAKNANVPSLSYIELTGGMVKILPFPLGFTFYDQESNTFTHNPAYRTNLDFAGTADENVTRSVSEQKSLVDNSRRTFTTAADLSSLGLPLGISYRIDYRGNNTTNATFGINFATRTLGGVSVSTIIETYTTNDNIILTRTKTSYGEGTHNAASLQNVLTLGSKIDKLTISLPLTVEIRGTLQTASYTQVVENPGGTVVTKDTANLTRDNKNILFAISPRVGFPIVKGTDIEVALQVGYVLMNPKAVSYTRVQQTVPTDTVTTTTYTEERKNFLELPLALQLVIKQSHKLGDAISLKGRVRSTLSYTISSYENLIEDKSETKVAGATISSEKVLIQDKHNTNRLSLIGEMPLGIEYALQKWFVLRFGSSFVYNAQWLWGSQERVKPSRELNGTPAPIGGTTYDPVDIAQASFAFTFSSSTTFRLGFGWIATENFQLDFGYELGAATSDIFSLSQWRIEGIYRF